MLLVVSSLLHQQQPVRSDGLLYDGPRLDVVAAFGDVDQPDVFSLTLHPLLWVDAILKNHFVLPPVHFGRERLAVLLCYIDVWRGVHASAPRLLGDQTGGGGIQKLRLVGGGVSAGQDDAEGAVHVVSVVGHGPGVLPRPEPAVPAVISPLDLQGDPVPPTGTNVGLIPTQERGVTILEVHRGGKQGQSWRQVKQNANMLHANHNICCISPDQ